MPAPYDPQRHDPPETRVQPRVAEEGLRVYRNRGALMHVSKMTWPARSSSSATRRHQAGIVCLARILCVKCA